MAANTISQLTTANTFEQWLIATQALIATANLITNGNGETFYANTKLEIGGPDATLNVVTSATIEELYSNDIIAVDTSTTNLTVTQNIVSVNVTNDVVVGNDLIVYGDGTITGNLVVTGNLTLDNIGFDDLNVSGSGSFGNNLTVIGTSDFTGNATFANAEVTGVLTANVLSGNANTAIYNSISEAIIQAESTGLAFSIALG
jgi:hypothetical protein